MSFKININGILNNIKDNLPQSGPRKERLQKLWMGVKSNQGVIQGIPMPPFAAEGEEPKSEFHQFLRGVYEVKLYDDHMESERWHRILPKSAYGPLSKEDEELYDYVTRELKYLAEQGYVDWTKLKRKSYGLMYLAIIGHYDVTNQPVADTKSGKIAMVVVPSAKLQGAMSQDIEGNTITAGGDTAWLNYIYMPGDTERKDRQGSITVGCRLNAENKYEISYKHNLDTPVMKAVPAGWEMEEGQWELCKGLIPDFLGWQVDKEGNLFNREMFHKIKTWVRQTIDDAEMDDDDVEQAEAPVQKQMKMKSMDPDLQESSPAQDKAPAPSEEHIDPMGNDNDDPPF
jgi:hypothetical protein